MLPCYHVLHLPVVAAVAEVPGRGLADDDPVWLFLNYRASPELWRQDAHVERHVEFFGQPEHGLWRVALRQGTYSVRDWAVILDRCHCVRPPWRNHQLCSARTGNLLRPVQCHRHVLLYTLWSRVLLKKLTGFQSVQKFPAFYGTRRFITTFTNTRHLSLF